MKNEKIIIALSGKEKEMIGKICEALGCGISELVRGLLRDKYTRLFPAYKDIEVRRLKEVKEPKVVLTHAQICEMRDGRVTVDGKTKYCTDVDGQTGYSVPLEWMDRPAFKIKDAEEFLRNKDE